MRGRERGDEAELDGRRELLELLAFLGAARVRRRERGELGQHVEQPRVRSRAGAHAGEVAAQEEQLRGLARLVGVLPDPGAFAVGGAERFASWLRAACAHRAAAPRSREPSRVVAARSRRAAGRASSAAGAGRGGQARIGRRRRQVAWAASVRLERREAPGPARSREARPDTFFRPLFLSSRAAVAAAPAGAGPDAGDAPLT